MLFVPGPAREPGGGFWRQEPGSILVEKQLAASAHRSGTYAGQPLVCSPGRLATQLQSTAALLVTSGTSVYFTLSIRTQSGNHIPPLSLKGAWAMFVVGLAMPMNSPLLLPAIGATVVEAIRLFPAS